MLGAAGAWLGSLILDAAVGRGLESILDRARGTVLRQRLQGISSQALRDTVDALVPPCDDESERVARVRRIADLLDATWPRLDLAPRTSGSFLDAIEEMVARALVAATSAQDAGDGFLPTSTLDVIADSEGIVLDPVTFGADLVARIVRAVKAAALTDDVVKPFADQLNHEQSQRVHAPPPVPGRLDVEFDQMRAAPLFAGFHIDDLAVLFINGGGLPTSQVTFRFHGRSPHLGEPFDLDSRDHGQATVLPPAGSTGFLVASDLRHMWRAFDAAQQLGVLDTDEYLCGPDPITVEITPTYLNGVSATPVTGPTARARVRWQRDGLTYRLQAQTQVLSPLGPPA